jgi:hypothetical protein
LVHGLLRNLGRQSVFCMADTMILAVTLVVKRRGLTNRAL